MMRVPTYGAWLAYWRGRSWIVRFSAVSLAAVVVIVALCWIVFGFGSLGLDPAATVAAVLGITLTAALGIALMALVFYSDRIGQDDAARDATTAGERENDDL